MKSYYLLLIGAMGVVNCTVPDDLGKNKHEELSGSQLYSASKLTNDETLRISEEIKNDTSVSFPEPLESLIWITL